VGSVRGRTVKSATVFGVALDFFVFGGASGAIVGVGCDRRRCVVGRSVGRPSRGLGVRLFTDRLRAQYVRSVPIQYLRVQMLEGRFVCPRKSSS